MNPADVKRTFAMRLAQLGTPVTLHWAEYAGGTRDETTGFVEGATKTDQSEAIKGFWYDVEDGGRVRQQHWQVYEQLHAIVDVLPTVTVEGRSDFRVEKDGVIYVPAKVAHGQVVGRQVEMIAGMQIYRTLYLMKAV